MRSTSTSSSRATRSSRSPGRRSSSRTSRWSWAAPPRSWPWGSRGSARRSRSWAASARTPSATSASSSSASRGIDLSRVIRGGGVKTGLTVAITHPLDRALVTYLGAISALTGKDVPTTSMAGCDHLHSSSFFFQEGLRPDFPDLFARAQAAGLTTSLDTGYDSHEQWDGGLRATLAHTDLFFPNEVELAAITGTEDPAEGLRRLENGRTRVVAKLGQNGAMTLEGGRVVQRARLPRGDGRHDRRRRLLQRGLPPPVAAGRADRRVPAAGRRLRRAQHAGPRRDRRAADPRGGRGARAQPCGRVEASRARAG